MNCDNKNFIISIIISIFFCIIGTVLSIFIICTNSTTSLYLGISLLSISLTAIIITLVIAICYYKKNKGYNKLEQIENPN